MSSFLIEICEIRNIKPHPNADRLDIAEVKGWQVVVGKDYYTEGDLIIYLPPDTIVPKILHEMLNITNYLASLPKDMNTEDRRVKAVRLRGEPSYGVIVNIEHVVNDETEEDFNLAVADDKLAEYLGVYKWVPPVKITAEDAAPYHTDFITYTDIENFNNFPNVLFDGEEVVISEKLHGGSSMVGYMLEDGQLTYMAGSHNVRRKESEDGLYWFPYRKYRIREWLAYLYKKYDKPIIVYGELYGQGVQDMDYGSELSYRVFDISVGGEYLNFEECRAACERFQIPQVPVLYRGPFSKEILREHTDGDSTIGASKKFTGREGCVVKPLKERYDAKIGRVILKSISVDYLNRKNPVDKGE